MYKIRWPKIQTKQNNNTNNKNSCSGGEKMQCGATPTQQIPSGGDASQFRRMKCPLKTTKY